MKLASIALAALAALAIACLPACQTPAQNAKLAAIGDLALAYAEANGKITPEDAALAREVGKLVVTNDGAPVVLGEVTASK